jgi:hypothetical protein
MKKSKTQGEMHATFSHHTGRQRLGIRESWGSIYRVKVRGALESAAKIIMMNNLLD